jgi:hypothetical protein
MEDHFCSAKSLLDRGRHHLREVESRIALFYGSNPYEIHSRQDATTGEIAFVAVFNRGTPRELPPIVFDCLNSFRSALDHAVYGATIILSRDNDPQETKFPFGNTRSSAAREYQNGAVCVPVALREFLLDFGPYKSDGASGNNLLWGFNRIRNRKIHRILAPAAATTKEISVAILARSLQVSKCNGKWP